MVVAHTKAQSSTILAADFVDEELQISGNDGVALTCLSTVIDAIGGAVSNAFNIDIFTRAHKTIDWTFCSQKLKTKSNSKTKKKYNYDSESDSKAFLSVAGQEDGLVSWKRRRRRNAVAVVC